MERGTWIELPEAALTVADLKTSIRHPVRALRPSVREEAVCGFAWIQSTEVVEHDL
jgi:hypothetical protein